MSEHIIFKIKVTDINIKLSRVQFLLIERELKLVYINLETRSLELLS